MLGLRRGGVAQHLEEIIGKALCEREKDLAVAVTFGALAFAYGPLGRVVEGRRRIEEGGV